MAYCSFRLLSRVAQPPWKSSNRRSSEVTWMEKHQSTMAISNPSADQLDGSIRTRRASKLEYLVKRATDLVLALAVLPLLVFPMLLIALAVKLTSKGPVLYWSDRVGRNNRIFRMPKFRSMRRDS